MNVQNIFQLNQKIIVIDLRNIKPDNDELINYMFIKPNTFDEEYINEER